MIKINVPTINDAIRSIPEEEQCQIQEWGLRRSKDNRWLAQMAIEFIERDELHGTKLGRMLIYDAVAVLSGAIKARTVRLWVMTELFFPKEAWEEFGILPHSHFVFAANRDNWREILTKSVELMDELGGRLPTVEHLERLFCFTESPAIGGITTSHTKDDGYNFINSDPAYTDKTQLIHQENDEEQNIILKGIVDALGNLLTIWSGDKRKLKTALQNLLDELQ